VSINSRLCLAICLFATSPVFAGSGPVELHTAASESFTASVAGPKNAGEAVVMIHDWFGTSPFYSQVEEKLAGEGYRVVALDLYGGQSATTHERAGTLLGALNDDLAGRKVDAAINWLGDRPRKVAVVGFSMGGKYALAAALRNGSVRATVLWYAETIKDSDKLKSLAGPALLIVGSADGTSAAADAASFSKAADAAGKAAEVYIYPGAAHAFAQPLFNRGRTYDPVAADVAWRLSLDFLQRRLK
jgi:carboxymethylenebutenolidase